MTICVHQLWNTLFLGFIKHFDHKMVSWVTLAMHNPFTSCKLFMQRFYKLKALTATTDWWEMTSCDFNLCRMFDAYSALSASYLYQVWTLYYLSYESYGRVPVPTLCSLMTLSATHTIKHASTKYLWSSVLELWEGMWTCGVLIFCGTLIPTPGLENDSASIVRPLTSSLCDALSLHT